MHVAEEGKIGRRGDSSGRPVVVAPPGVRPPSQHHTRHKQPHLYNHPEEKIFLCEEQRVVHINIMKNVLVGHSDLRGHLSLVNVLDNTNYN